MFKKQKNFGSLFQNFPILHEYQLIKAITESAMQKKSLCKSNVKSYYVLANLCRYFYDVKYYLACELNPYTEMCNPQLSEKSLHILYRPNEASAKPTKSHTKLPAACAHRPNANSLKQNPYLSGSNINKVAEMRLVIKKLAVSSGVHTKQ